MAKLEQPVLFLFCLAFIIFLTSVVHFKFLKTSVIQSHSAVDSLIVCTLQNSPKEEARFVQSRGFQAVFRREASNTGMAHKELAF